MNAVESLIREHQLIARLSDALEAYARQTQQGRPPDPTHLGRFAAAFTDFAECIHHEKEENILLPMLSRHGVRWDHGALPAVRRQHRQEAYLIDVLRQAGERAGSWHNEDRRHIAASALALVEFQRQHHLLESVELLPLIATHLDEAQLAQLREALDKFDREHERRRTSTQEQIEELIAHYAPPSASGVHAIAAELLDDSEPGQRCLGVDE